MKNLIYYNSIDVFRHNHEKLPGGKNFSMIFYVMGGNYVFHDRGNNVSMPLNYKLMDHLKLPEFKKFDKSFEQICDERAVELYRRAENSNRKLAVMYSGGIDSTLVITSLLKNLNREQLKNVVVLMNEESIFENRNFYYNYISKNLTCIPSFNYGAYATSKEYMLISGEQADMLFLPGFVFDFLNFTKNKLDSTFLPLDQTKGQVIDCINYMLPAYKEKNSAENIYHTIEKVCKSAPVEIKNIQDMWWWAYFITKWQSCYLRMLGFIPNPNLVEFETGYTTFFCNDNFQLWSMNNRESIIKNGMDTYKFVQKDYIYDFNKDLQYYKEKKKLGSLGSAVRRKKPIVYMDSGMNFSYDMPSTEFFNYNNDFTNWI
jgi:hypothetical protein